MVLLAPPTPQSKRASVEFDPLSWIETVEPKDNRLARALAACQKNEGALAAVLGKLAPWQRLRAQLLLMTEIGYGAARELCRRVFGRAPTESQTKAAAPSPQIKSSRTILQTLVATFGPAALDIVCETHSQLPGSAEAVTVDGKIYVAPQRWNLKRAEGRVLLGHEVAHALQQRRGRSGRRLEASHRRELEHEAEAAGHAFARGKPFAVRGQAPRQASLFRGAKVSPETAVVDLKAPRIPPKPGTLHDHIHIAYGTRRLASSVAIERNEAGEAIAFTRPSSLRLTLPYLGEITCILSIGANHSLEAAAEGLLAVSALKIPGLIVLGGSLNIYLRDGKTTIDAQGVTLSLPGQLGSGTLSVTAGAEPEFAASLQLDLPKAKGARLALRTTRQAVFGEGALAVDFVGAKGEIAIRYEQEKGAKAKWQIEGDVSYDSQTAVKNRLNGTLRVGYNLGAGAENGHKSLYGSGSLTYAIADRLSGTATVQVDASGYVSVLGEIRPAAEFSLFDKKEIEETLVPVHREFPLWGLVIPVVDQSVGLVAFIDAKVAARVGLGEGKMRNICLAGQVSNDPAVHPHFAISGDLFLPTYAELVFDIRGGVKMGAVIASISAGIDLQGRVGFYGGVSSHLSLGYEEGKYRVKQSILAGAAANFAGALAAYVKLEWMGGREHPRLGGGELRWDYNLAHWELPLGLPLLVKGEVDHVLGQPFAMNQLQLQRPALPEVSSFVQAAMPQQGLPQAKAEKPQPLAAPASSTSPTGASSATQNGRAAPPAAPSRLDLTNPSKKTAPPPVATAPTAPISKPPRVVPTAIEVAGEVEKLAIEPVSDGSDTAASGGEVALECKPDEAIVVATQNDKDARYNPKTKVLQLGHINLAEAAKGKTVKQLATYVHTKTRLGVKWTKEGLFVSINPKRQIAEFTFKGATPAQVIERLNLLTTRKQGPNGLMVKEAADLLGISQPTLQKRLDDQAAEILNELARKNGKMPQAKERGRWTDPVAVRNALEKLAAEKCKDRTTGLTRAELEAAVLAKQAPDPKTILAMLKQSAGEVLNEIAMAQRKTPVVENERHEATSILNTLRELTEELCHNRREGVSLDELAAAVTRGIVPNAATIKKYLGKTAGVVLNEIAVAQGKTPNAQEKKWSSPEAVRSALETVAAEICKNRKEGMRLDELAVAVEQKRAPVASAIKQQLGKSAGTILNEIAIAHGKIPMLWTSRAAVQHGLELLTVAICKDREQGLSLRELADFLNREKVPNDTIRRELGKSAGTALNEIALAQGKTPAVDFVSSKVTNRDRSALAKARRREEERNKAERATAKQLDEKRAATALANQQREEKKRDAAERSRTLQEEKQAKIELKRNQNEERRHQAELARASKPPKIEESRTRTGGIVKEQTWTNELGWYNNQILFEREGRASKGKLTVRRGSVTGKFFFEFEPHRLRLQPQLSDLPSLYSADPGKEKVSTVTHYTAQTMAFIREQKRAPHHLDRVHVKVDDPDILVEVGRAVAGGAGAATPRLMRFVVDIARGLGKNIDKVTMDNSTTNVALVLHFKKDAKDSKA